MHRSRVYLSALVLALLLLSAVPAVAATQSDVSEKRDSASAARRKADAADAKASKLAKEASKLDGKIDALQETVDDLQPQIDAAAARVNRLRAEVESLRSEIGRKQTSIDRTSAELSHQQSLLAARVTASYKAGRWYYLTLLLGSDNLGDFVARTELVSRVMKSNSQLAEELGVSRRSLELERRQLDRDLQGVSDKRAEAQAVATHLEQMQAARQSVLSEQRAVFDEKSSMVAESRANASRLRRFADEEDAEANRIAAELSSRKHGSGQFSGSMLFPCPAGQVTSGFGWRVHPIFGDRRFHKGIDIGAASGSSVIAAGSGTVIKAESGWGGGYGNRVWIDHGNGVVTTYNHLQSFSVSEGDSVRKGQTIARVGSTGNSTGPHLHFEVWVNGEARNPMDYL